MELPINTLGQVLKGLYESGYFESESLEQAIEQLLKDEQLTFGISIQDNPGE